MAVTFWGPDENLSPTVPFDLVQSRKLHEFLTNTLALLDSYFDSE